MEKILLPEFLNDYSFENVFRQVAGRLERAEAGSARDLRPVIDGTKIQFIDPYGMVGLIEIGRFLSGLGLSPFLSLPPAGDVAHYLERMDFHSVARGMFDLEDNAPKDGWSESRREDSDVLLEITPIAHTCDIHGMVAKVAERANLILQKHLHYNDRAIHAFIVSLSEICQNILEHSENTGFVGIQKYFYHRSLGKNVVKIAVMDLGIGIRHSLGSRLSGRYGEDWSDLVAIEQALLFGASRHEESGRGHGLTEVRKFIKQWNGKITIRSGTAKISILPPWERGRPRFSRLSSFPGTQINIVLPESELR